MKARYLALLFLMPIACSGCSSIICGSEKTVNINSHPKRAKFKISNSNKSVVIEGVTPTNVTLKRGSGYFSAGDYTVSFQKEGYQDLTTNVNQGLTGWYVGGNLFFGGLIGWVFVDPLTGAMWDIKDINATMKPIPGKKIIGYRSTINPATGEPETTPIYEENNQ